MAADDDRDESAKNIIETVRTYMEDIEESTAHLKTLKERQAEILEKVPEHATVEEAQEALKKAQDDLKYKLMQNSDYNDVTEQIADQRTTVKDQKEILSTYLLEHYRSTGEHQILLDESNGDARELVLKGSLGKETKYQTNLFGGRDD